MQLFYTDFWNTISDKIKNKIKKYIEIKNLDFIKYYKL